MIADGIKAEMAKVAPGDRIEYLDGAPRLSFPVLTEEPRRGTVVDVHLGLAGRVQTVFSRSDDLPDGLRVDYHAPGLVAVDVIRKVQD